MPAFLSEPVEGCSNAEQAARMQRRFRAAYQRLGSSQGRRAPRIVLNAADGVLVLCLLVCLGAIGLGLDRMYPLAGPRMAHAFHDDLPDRPFPDCDSAYAAGIHDIPVGHPAYSEGQDSDRDGLACEPT
jgi:hypothetical protein